MILHFSDYESEAGDEDEAEGSKGKGQLAQLDDATLRERIATMGKGEQGFPTLPLVIAQLKMDCSV